MMVPAKHPDQPRLTSLKLTYNRQNELFMDGKGFCFTKLYSNGKITGLYLEMTDTFLTSSHWSN